MAPNIYFFSGEPWPLKHLSRQAVRQNMVRIKDHRGFMVIDDANFNRLELPQELVNYLHYKWRLEEVSCVIILHYWLYTANFAINQMKNFLDKPHLRMLSNAYVRSHVDYCTNLWTNCTKSTLKPLNVALKKSIHIITGRGRYDHTIPLYKAENILPLHNNIEYNALVFMHSYKYGYCPNSFTDVVFWTYDVLVNSIFTQR